MRVGLSAVAVGLLVSSLVAQFSYADPTERDPSPPTWPAWMTKLAKDIEPPTSLSQEEQTTCEDLILATLNTQFDAQFTTDDVALIDTPAWSQPENAFIRGGGYNIRIVASGLSTDETKRIHPGRFIGHIDGIPDDLKPSLHVPGTINGASLFSSEVTGGAGSVDFVAHIDTAYAYTPLGFIVHMVRDVWGAKGRNPCP